MLRVDLEELAREGSLPVEACIAADGELWQETDLAWASDVRVRLWASFAGTGEVIVRGRVQAELAQECARCLQPVSTSFGTEVTLVFMPGREDGDSDDGGTYVFDPERAELDLSGAVREEVIFAVDQYVVCDSECPGLCSKCGANLNDGACDCRNDELDPRWEALRSLKDK